MTPEAKVTQSIVKALEKLKAEGRNIWWVKLHGGPMQRVGLPDLLVVLDGRAIFLEVKSDVGVATKIQEHTIEQLQKAGAVAEVVRSADEAVQAILCKGRVWSESKAAVRARARTEALDWEPATVPCPPRTTPWDLR